jgi:hypothetical protein
MKFVDLMAMLEMIRVDASTALAHLRQRLLVGGSTDGRNLTLSGTPVSDPAGIKDRLATRRIGDRRSAGLGGWEQFQVASAHAKSLK